MTTRATLVDDINTWMVRDDLTAQAGTFIRLTEAWIDRKVRVRAQETTTQYPFAVNDPNVTMFILPNDFLEVISVEFNTGAVLEYLTPREFHPLAEGVLIPPSYTVRGGRLITSEPLSKPADLDPEAVTSLDSHLFLEYIARFSRLVNDDDTNWLLTNAYDIYLYKCLSAASEYVMDTENNAVYAAKADQAVRELHRSETREYIANTKSSRSTARPGLLV